MKNKINDKVRLIINRWFKKQRKVTDPDGKFRGYVITKSQAEKLKKELWRNIEFLNSNKQENDR